MKTVKSLADLKQTALAQGATVSVGGRQFNASGEAARVVAMPKQGTPVPKPDAVPDATPAPAPNVEVHPVNNVHVDTAAIAQAQMSVGRMVADALASLPAPAQPVKEWVFTVERDANGYTKTITAKAK